MFSSLGEARDLIEAWRIDYNTERPHTALGGLAPCVYAERNRHHRPGSGGWVKMPAPLHDLAKPLTPTFLELSRHPWTKSVPPEAHRLMSDVDAAFMEQVFNVPQ
ncbi:MAG TPA: hypothetical protein DF715_07650 [Oceanicaulis sp.]|nr:hypothetical protein [Oceanicaulis sp.]